MNQMNIYDWLYPDQIQPMRELAKIAEPHYQESRQRLIELNKEDPDMNRWAAAVKKEYIPHGYYGHHEPGNNPNTIQAYTMQTDHISVDYTDHEGQRHLRWYSWADFAVEVSDLIYAGEYGKDEE